MRVLLVEPKKGKQYHTPYPPLALLKLSTYHKSNGDDVALIEGPYYEGPRPDLIYITSLFTYAYKPVHEVIKYYRKKFVKARIVVGGIYATLCTDHLQSLFGNGIEIFGGLREDLDDLLPDYSWFPQFDTSIVFASRGCVRKCRFCSVRMLEPVYRPRNSIKDLIWPGHKKITFWDNNILASPFWQDIFEEVRGFDLKVDFNQGLDARFLNEVQALKLKELRIHDLRLAYDSLSIRPHLKSAIDLLKSTGRSGRRIIVYCIYNFLDSPEGFLFRIKDLMEWGVVAYPMRYEPLRAGRKNKFVSKDWTTEQLEMLAKARRVIGWGGAFPPYEGLQKKILDASNFEEAFELRPKR